MEVFIRRRFSSPIGTHCPVIVIRVVLITHDTHHHQMTPTSGDSHLHQVIVIYIRWQLSSGDTHETSNSHHPMMDISGWLSCDSDSHQKMMSIAHDSHPSPTTHRVSSEGTTHLSWYSPPMIFTHHDTHPPWYSPTHDTHPLMILTHHHTHCSMLVINRRSPSEDGNCQR